MSVYESARKHAWFMASALGLSILFVLVIDQYLGHSTIAFAVAIIGLIAANRRMLSMNCPRCEKNLFFRGIFVVPWPNRTCGRCGLELNKQSDDQS